MFMVLGIDYLWVTFFFWLRLGFCCLVVKVLVPILGIIITLYRTFIPYI